MAVTLATEIAMCAENPLYPSEFYLGRAIASLDEDRLGRRGFAEHLADGIAAYHGKEGLVLAVNAPWGDGKTSLTNMVCDALEKNHSGGVVPLTFNPWEWASQNQVAEAFFAELAKQIEAKDPSAQAQESAKRLRRLGRHLGMAGRFVSSAGALLNLALPGASLVTTPLAKGAEAAKAAARESAADLDEAAGDARQTLPKVKEELRRCLQRLVEEQKKKLLVIIDDVDRLSPEEIRLVLQLVKVNADFPGIVFLLLFDTQFVLKALEGFFNDRAQEFLEKIVQFQVDLPSLREGVMRAHVWDALQRVFHGRQGWLRLCGRERFHALWEAGLGDYLTNLRHADRLLSSFEFHIGAYRSSEAEVNPLDFLVLEAIRLFEGGVYAAIRSSASLLFPRLGEPDDSIELDQQSDSSDECVSGHEQRRKAEWEKVLKTLAEKAGASTRDTCLRLLWWLFPERVDRDRQFDPTEQHHAVDRDKRIASLLYFSRYFRLAVDEEDVADRDIITLAGMMDEPDRFVAELRRYKEGGLLCLALTKLLRSEGLRASCRPEELIGLLLDFREAAGEVASAPHHLGFADALRKLIELQLPENLGSRKRCDRLIGGIKQCTAVHSVVEMARHERRDHRRAREPAWRAALGGVLEACDLERLDEVVADRIQPVLATGQIAMTNACQRSLEWFLLTQPSRAKAISEALLDNATTVGLMLCLVVRDEQLSVLTALSDGEVNTPLIVNAVGWEAFDAALEKHKEALGKLVERASDRIQVARRAHAGYVEQIKAKQDSNANAASVQESAAD